ncbi:MAG: hypothetical protein ACQET8_22635 [Bacillota bacterium]
MRNRQGNGYLGSSGIQTSTANKEVVTLPKSANGSTLPFYKLSFLNLQSCKVKINGGNPIYLEQDQGFEMNESDAPIYSFVIVEAGIQYQWIGAY